MKQVKFVIVAALALLALLAACGQQVDTTQPPEIAYGEDVCSNCNMLISDEKFASAYWTVDGEARRFDDVGEMLSFMRSTPEETASVWVHDVNSAEWLPAEEAYFVVGSGLTTPMGTGIVACDTQAEAEALAYDQDGAMVMTFADVLAMNEAGAMDMGSSMDHDKDSDMAPISEE